MILNSLLLYLTTYFISYSFVLMIQKSINLYNRDEFLKIDKHIWIKLFLIINILLIHYFWLYTRKYLTDDYGKVSYIIPLIFITPLYITFIYQYIDYRFVIKNKENEKWNRILDHVMILLIAVHFLFFFLSRKYQNKLLEYINILFLFELI